MKVFLIRHGETIGDIEDRYGGVYDDHLTEKGKEQLAMTAAKLADTDIEIIFSSPLIRAQESAEIINTKLNKLVEIIDDLQERHYGILTGLTKAEALQKYPEAVEAHKNPAHTDPEGESQSDFKARVVAAYQSLVAKQYNTIALVAHGGSLKAILEHLGEPLPDSIGDGGIIEIDA